MMNKFYIYRHIRLDSNTPFYVGKGSNNRAFVKSGRSDYWMKIVNKCDISLCLRKKKKQVKGYIFEYTTKDESNG